MTKTGALVIALAFAAPLSPSPPLGALPSIPRVRIEVASDHVVAIEEIDLPRGDWRSGELAFFVAFGGPGVPQAFDAHLLAVPDGALEPLATDVGEKVVTERAPRRPATVLELIGAEDMAGVVVRVPEATFRRALAPGGMAALRLRTLLGLPAGNARSGHDVLVRLGDTRSTPLTLGRVEVASVERGAGIARITRAEAHLCGESADPWPLAVAIEPRPTGPAPTGAQAPIAPVLAVRNPDDDLCVRFWIAE